MKTSSFAASLLLFLASLAPLAAEKGWLHFRGDPYYEAEYWGELLSGKIPSLAFPLFGAEITGAGTELGWKAERRGLSLSLSTPSLAYDTPFTGTSQLSTPPSPKLPELQRAIGRLPDLARLDLGLLVGESLSVRTDMELSYRRDAFVGSASTASWPLDQWLFGLLADIEFPRRSWISYGGEGLGLAAGRFPAGIGAGHFGSLTLNPEALYYDQLLLHLGGDRLRLVWMLGSSSAQLSAGEAEVQWRRVTTADHDADPSRIIGDSYWDSLNDHDFAAGRNALKLFAYHLLEWRPIESLRLGLAESSVMGGSTPAFNFFLPGLLWHNTYSAGYANVAMTALASFTPLPGLLLSGEFLVDDTRATDEPIYAKPDSYAWQASASYSLSPEPGSLLSFGAEYSHVDEWTYVRWQPYLTPYQRQILPGGSRGIDYPLGYTYGPDCDQIGLWARLVTSSGASLEFSWELLWKGPIYMGMVNWIDNIETTGSTLEPIPVYYDYDKYAGAGKLAEILSRPDEIRNILTLSGKLPLPAGLSARLALSLGFYKNYGHVTGALENLLLFYAGLAWSPAAGGAE